MLVSLAATGEGIMLTDNPGPRIRSSLPVDDKRTRGLWSDRGIEATD